MRRRYLLALLLPMLAACEQPSPTTPLPVRPPSIVQHSL
jgi:hypothetical protein